MKNEPTLKRANIDLWNVEIWNITILRRFIHIHLLYACIRCLSKPLYRVLPLRVWKLYWNMAASTLFRLYWRGSSVRSSMPRAILVRRSNSHFSNYHFLLYFLYSQKNKNRLKIRESQQGKCIKIKRPAHLSVPILTLIAIFSFAVSIWYSIVQYFHPTWLPIPLLLASFPADNNLQTVFLAYVCKTCTQLS